MPRREAAMLNYIDNREWRDLPVPKAGDAVHLKSDDSLGYTVRVLVDSVQGDTIIGRIDSIFDKDQKASVTGGEVTALVGRIVAAQRTKIFGDLKGIS